MEFWQRFLLWDHSYVLVIKRLVFTNRANAQWSHVLSIFHLVIASRLRSSTSPWCLVLPYAAFHFSDPTDMFDLDIFQQNPDQDTTRLHRILLQMSDCESIRKMNYIRILCTSARRCHIHMFVVIGWWLLSTVSIKDAWNDSILYFACLHWQIE